MDCSYKKKTPFTPTECSRLCSNHFLNENYQVKLDTTKEILLKENTVTNSVLCISFFLHYQKASKVSRKEP